MQKQFYFSYETLDSVVQEIKQISDNREILTFTGPLGAGKTTLIKNLLEEYGVNQNEVTSPTFSYVNIYYNGQGMAFYHFDLYRLHTPDEFISLGFDEYLYQPNSKIFIEWPAPILPLIKKDKACHITLDYGSNSNERIIQIIIP
jgi:tRNA threonylcarbamoyladenosine biosynthesis protein TsaE